MLVDKHPYGDAAHVEPVQEVLYGMLQAAVHLVGLLQLQDTLGHGLHHVSVTVVDLG